MLVGKEIERDREKGTHLKSCGRQPRAIKKREKRKNIYCAKKKKKKFHAFLCERLVL